MSSQIQYRYSVTNPKLRFNQGDILKDINLVVPTSINTETEEVSISRITLSYGVVVNQECDLEHDFTCRSNPTPKDYDKYLPNILILPAYLPDSFKRGEHRDNLVGNIWSTDQMKRIKQNNELRFHFLDTEAKYQIPELIIDFKHVHTVNSDVIYSLINKIYLASISEIFRENLSQRYCNYLSRIGLP